MSFHEPTRGECSAATTSVASANAKSVGAVQILHDFIITSFLVKIPTFRDCREVLTPAL